MRRTTLIAALILTANAAQAQLGDLLKKIDPNKVKKTAEVARQATREFTEAEEADIGRVVAARILNTYPLSEDVKLQKYVTLVGKTVAVYSARPTLEWHFAVVESPVVNAISAPGGFIFITTGALKQMKSEAELATVLAHEIAHVTQKHILKEVKRSNVIGAGVDLAQSTSAGSQWLNDDYASKIGQIAVDKLFKSGLSRSDEMESDRIAVQLADAAGYRAAEFVAFLETLKSLERSSEMRQLIATHPSPGARQSAVKSLVPSDRGVVLADRWSQWTTFTR
jgi:beta-barrel assembly-enhancing protease